MARRSRATPTASSPSWTSATGSGAMPIATERGPEVRELLGIDHRAHALDLAGGDIQRPDADHPLLAIDHQRARCTVDVGRADGRSGNPGAGFDPVEQR